ncbi:Toluene-4-monooxygenase system ferredoxin subunit (plasmid) [Mycobacterium sp. THAF192]|nr:Toluene-4-monooxygenase system ferredoxin subunit [Mycobacterium sp. THAF192]
MMTEHDLTGFHEVSTLDELWAGETQLIEVAGTKVILVHTDDGVVSAIQEQCPHQKVSLADAELDGNKLTCSMHLWEMNPVTGCGINPGHAALALYPTQVIDGRIYVSVDGITPTSARS